MAQGLPVLSQFYPGIDLALRVANSRIVEERVRDGEVDVGMVGGHVLGPGERCVTAGVLDELVLIVPRGHPLALDASASDTSSLMSRQAPGGHSAVRIARTTSGIYSGV